MKKELKALLEDPPGVADQLDQLSSPQIFTWAELMSILGVVFSRLGKISDSESSNGRLIEKEIPS